MRYMPAVRLLAAVSCGPATADQQTDVQECVANGIAWFEEIGSYPTLGDGRDAEQVAIERCDRTTQAFPERGSE